MTMTALNGLAYYPDMIDIALLSNTNTFTFDGATDLLAVVLHVPATGTIANVHYNVNTASTPSLTLRTELRTVSATTGQPNAAGTLYGSSTSITVANPTTGNKTAAVNATAATAGDLCAVVWDLSAFTSGSFTLSQALGNTVYLGATGFPYAVRNTTGTTALASLVMNCFALEYSGSVYYPLETSCVVATSATQNVNTTTPRAGNLFTAPAPLRACGMYAIGGSEAVVDCSLELRDGVSDTVLATCTIDKDQVMTGSQQHFRFFDSRSTVNLTKGSTYRALLRQDTSASSDNLRYLTSIPANAQLGQLSGGANCYGTRYNGSTYTDTNTDRLGIGIIYDGVDDGAGGAAGVKYRVNMGMG